MGVGVGSGVGVAVGFGVEVGVGVNVGVGVVVATGPSLSIFTAVCWRRPIGLSGFNTHASYTTPPNVIKAWEYCQEKMSMKPRRTSMSVSFGNALG